MKRRLFNVLAGASMAQRFLCAFLILVQTALITAWATSYVYPISFSLTLSRQYQVRCDAGSWQWVVTSYTQIVGLQPSGAPIQESDARKIVGACATERLKFAQWPWFQRGIVHIQTQQVFAVHSGRSSTLQRASNGKLTRVYAVPCWLPLLLPIGIGGLMFWRMRADAEDRSAGRCAECGYDLRATPDRCPECGNGPETVNG